ncbi:MAG TPA: AAA family ATPase [Thermoleophilaceae bacterium]|nr:AAA family ATPase [Thermoleophilaceae bacterium]
MAAHRAPGFLGRTREGAVLEQVFADVRQGQSAVLVVRGEAGIGKTALLRHAARQASDFRVAQIAGVEAEMELPFAGVHQLCAPMFSRIDALPKPQRDALSVALGRSSGGTPDRFLVALAVLSLLSEVAEEQPLLCVVDDAQWLDDASDQVLGFVARRLLAESVAIVFGVREPGNKGDFAGLPELPLGGLDEEDARALLANATPGRLDDRVRDRIIAETRGNPLALLELPRSIGAAELAGGFTLPVATDLPGHIQDHYMRRVGELPRASQQLMLLAAADPVGDATLLWRAAERLGIEASALAPAQDAQLLEIGARVRFRHPLVRSAVYQAASPGDRQGVHGALAKVSDPEADADRRAWHRALAAAAPDEDVAAELEHSAGRAQARGGLAAAAAFLQRAVALTRDPRRRTERALAAADFGLRAGAFDAARGMMAAAEIGPLDELQQARLDLLRAEASYSESRGGTAPALLLRAAKALESLEPQLARETYLDAWSSALFAGRLASSVNLHDVSREARSAPMPTDRRPSDVLLDGFSLAFTEGRSSAAPVLERAATGFAGDDVPVEEVLRWGWLATAAAVMVWDYETCLAVARRGVELAREAGALTVLAVSVNVMAQATTLGGEFGRATSLVAEADAVTEATGGRVAPYGALVHAGFQGREKHTSGLIGATIKEFTAGGQGTAVQYARWARSVLLNGLGRYREAIVAAQEASDDTPELFVSVWAAIELLEAASRCDETELAREALDRVLAATAVAPTDWAAGIAARSRALVSEGQVADDLYQEAIRRLGRTPLRPEHARAHLLYGEWLRRENRRVDARAQLRTAHELFAAIGMEAFAERARGELLATGATVRKRRTETRDELTAQESQIARLARDGLSNPEIGARLFLSPRTVEWHLRKVFSKLGIRSRRELARRLPASDSELLPA